MKNSAIYTSKCSAKNLWKEYRIYDDHLEFSTIFGEMTIPFDQIEHISVEESDVKGLLHGNMHLKNFRPALKIDWANFIEHIVLDKNAGHIKRILFTPDDPHAFIKALNDAILKHKEN